MSTPERVAGAAAAWLAGLLEARLVCGVASQQGSRAARNLEPDDAVKRANASLKHLADAQAAEVQSCRGKLADLEFKVEAQSSSGHKSTDACVQELTIIKGLSIKEREAIRVAGGRLYVGAVDAWTQGSPAVCRLNVPPISRPAKRPCAWPLASRSR